MPSMVASSIWNPCASAKAGRSSVATAATVPRGRARYRVDIIRPLLIGEFLAGERGRQRRRNAPLARLLVAVRHLQQRQIVEGFGHELQGDGQVLRGVARGHDDSRQA